MRDMGYNKKHNIGLKSGESGLQENQDHQVYIVIHLQSHTEALNYCLRCKNFTHVS